VRKPKTAWHETANELILDEIAIRRYGNIPSAIQRSPSQLASVLRARAGHERVREAIGGPLVRVARLADRKM
jgi:hypothetical protein